MELRYFLFGFVFISLLYPILDEITQLIITWFEAGKAKLSEKINTTNIKIKKDALESEKTGIEITGFGTYQQKEEDTDDDI